MDFWDVINDITSDSFNLFGNSDFYTNDEEEREYFDAARPDPTSTILHGEREFENDDEKFREYLRYERTDGYHNKCVRGYCDNIRSDDKSLQWISPDYFQPNAPIKILNTIFFNNSDLCQCMTIEESILLKTLKKFEVFNEGWNKMEMFQLAKSAICDYCDCWRIFRTPEGSWELVEVLYAYTMRQLGVKLPEYNVINAWFNQEIRPEENIPIVVQSDGFMSKFQQLTAIKHIFKYKKHSKALLLEWGRKMREKFDNLDLIYEESDETLEGSSFHCIDYVWIQYLPLDFDLDFRMRMKTSLVIRSIKDEEWYSNFGLYPGFIWYIYPTRFQKIFSKLNFNMITNFQFDENSWMNLIRAMSVIDLSDEEWIYLFNEERGKEYMLNCMIYGPSIDDEKFFDNQFMFHLSVAHHFKVNMRSNIINIILEQDRRRDSLFMKSLNAAASVQLRNHYWIYPVRTKVSVDAEKLTKCQLQSLKSILKENPDAQIVGNTKKLDNTIRKKRDQKNVKFEAQMFGFDNSKLEKNLDILPNLEPRLISILESGDDLTARMSSLMNLLETNIMPAFINITGNVQETIIPNLCDTSENLRNVSQQASSAAKLLKTLTCIVLIYIFMKYSKFRKLVLIMLGIYLGVSIVRCFNFIKEVMNEQQQINEFEAQMGAEELTPIVLKLCVLVVTAVGIGKLPETKKIDQFMTRITSFSRMIKGMDDLCSYTNSIMPKLTEWWHQLILGEKDYITPLNIPDIDNWIAEIKKYSTLANKDEIMASTVEIEKMSKLHPKGLDFLRQARNENWGPKTLNIISQANAVARSLWVLAGSSGKINLTEFRDEPLTLMLSGPAGVGKSFLTRTMASDLMFEAGIPEENHTGNIYTRNSSSEFYDGYTGQFVFLDDEFLATKDDKTKPNIDVSDVLLWHNTTTNILNMAELIQKACTYFTSKVIMLTTNVPYLDTYVNSLNHPEALYRRINPNLLVHAKKEYQKNYKSKNPLDHVIDHTKFPQVEPGKFFMNAWDFWYIDPKTGKKLDNKAYNYKEVITKLKSMLRERLDKCKDVSKQIKAYKEAGGIDAFAEQFEMQMDDYDDAVELLTNEEIEQDDMMSDFMMDFNIKLDKEILKQERFKRIFSERIRKILSRRSNLTENSLMLWFKTKYESIDMLEQYNNWKNSFMTNLIIHKEKIDSILSISKYLGLLLAGMVIAWSVFKIFSSNNDNEELNNDDSKENIVELKPGKRAKFLPHVPDEYRHLIIEQYAEMNFGEEKYPIFWTNLIHSGCARDNKKYVFIDEHPRCVNCLEIRFDLIDTLYNGGKSKIVDWDLHELQTNTRDGKPRSDGRSGRKAQKAFNHKSGRSQPYYEMQMGEMNCEKLRDYERMCADSLLDCFVWKEKSQSWVHMHNIFMIKGRTGLTNSHLHDYIKIQNIKKIMLKSNYLQQGIEMEVKDLVFRHLKTKDGKAKDACLIFFPVDDMPCFRDRTKHIIRERETKQIPDDSNSDLNAKLVTMHFDRGYPTVRTADVKELHCVGALVLTSTTQENMSRLIYDNLVYKAATIKGECGGPLFVNNNFFQNKIVGLHNGLRIGTSDVASGTLVTYEEIAPILNEFVMQSYTWDEEQLSEYIEERNTPIIVDDNEIVLHEGGIFENTNFVMIGDSNLKCSQPEKTKLIPSPICGQIEIFDQIYPNKHAPAVMGIGRTSEGKLVNVLEQGLAKQGRANVIIDRSLIERAKSSYFSKLMNMENELRTRRLLTLEETIKGIDGTLYFTGMNRKSSMGYPFSCMKLKKPGKKAYFGTDDYDFTSLEFHDFKYRFEHAIHQLENCVRPIIVFTDLCKDEKRKLEKVRECKTRTFSGGNALLQSIFNVYFGSFFAMLKYNKIEAESCVGVNVYSRDIDRMRDKLRTKGNDILLGDFTGFDASLNSRVFMAIVEGINEWYGDSVENMRVREFIWQEIYNSMHIKNDILYCWVKNQPSGQPATAEVNSLYLSLIFRIASYKIMEKFNIAFDFNDEISAILYGDDSALAFDSSRIGQYFNYKEITEAFKQLGMEYTDESKQESKELWRSIEELSFLKRKFIFNKDLRRYIAPLEFDSIFGMAYWIQKGPNIKKQLAINLQQFLSEIAIHGEGAYNSVVPSIKRLCRRERICMEIKPYRSHLIAMFDETIIGSGDSCYGETGFSI